MNKRRKRESVSKCNLVQMDISDSFNRWYSLQKMQQGKTKVHKFNSTLIIEVKDTDSEPESEEGYTDYISSIKERNLPFKILLDDEGNKKNVSSIQGTGPPANITTPPFKVINIGVNRPKSNPQITEPKATSTPFKNLELNSHVGFQDLLYISKNDTTTPNDSGSVSDADAERTVIYQESSLSKTPNKSVKIIGNYILNKTNWSDCSGNTLYTSQSSTNTTNKEASIPVRKIIADEESASKRQKVSHFCEENEHVSKKLFDGDIKESKSFPNSSVNVKNLNCSKIFQLDRSEVPDEKNAKCEKKKQKEDHAEKTPKEPRGSQLDGMQRKHVTKNLSEEGNKIGTRGESKGNKSIQSINKVKFTENSNVTTEKERNRDEQPKQITKTTRNKDKGKTLLKSMKDEQTLNSSSQPSCPTLSQKVNVTDTANIVTKKESNKDKSGESSRNTQDVNKGKTLLKGTDESQSNKTDGHLSSPGKEGNAKETTKIEAKAEDRKVNIKYVTLIQELFNTVYETNNLRNLLSDDRKAVDLFRDMNTNYQYMCVKLFTWQRKWYNIYKFCNRIYLNMGDCNIREMYHFFKEKGIVDTDFTNDDVLVLLELLDLVDLKSIRDKFKLKKTLITKQDIINGLLKCCSTQSTLTPKKSTLNILMEEIQHKLGHSIRLNESFHDAFYRTYVLATFANPTFSKMADYFKNVLHLRIAFPEYPVEDYAIFYSKDEFISYTKARKYKDALEEVLGKNHRESLEICKDIFEELQKTKENQNNYEDRYRNTPHLIRFTARAVYVSALSTAMSTLATKFPIYAKTWLEYMIKEVDFPHKIGEWYYHLSWLYMKYLEPIDYMHAAKLIIHVLQQKREHLSDVQLYQLDKRGQALKVTKKYKITQLYHDMIAELVPEPININEFPTITIDASTIRSNDLGKKRDYVILDKEGNRTVLSVEYKALMHYLDNGYTDGRHCEGSLIMATFTLFFWDIIYSAKEIVPGTFVSKVQSVPLDLNSSHFYLHRKNAIDKRLVEIETTWSDSELIKFAKENYKNYSHLVALCQVDRFINDAELLEIIIECIGRVVLAKIYERFVKNIRQYRSGLPDLLIWNANEKTSKFVEVKGENDTLSLGQTLWLDYLKSIGASIEVCKVHSIGSKRKKVQTPGDNKTMEPSTSTSPVVCKRRKQIQKVEAKPSTSSSFDGAKGKKNVYESEDNVCMESTSSSDEFESEM